MELLSQETDTKFIGVISNQMIVSPKNVRLWLRLGYFKKKSKKSKNFIKL